MLRFADNLHIRNIAALAAAARLEGYQLLLLVCCGIEVIVLLQIKDSLQHKVQPGYCSPLAAVIPTITAALQPKYNHVDNNIMCLQSTDIGTTFQEEKEWSDTVTYFDLMIYFDYYDMHIANKFVDVVDG